MTTKYIVVVVNTDGSKQVLYGKNTELGQRQIMDTLEEAEEDMGSISFLFPATMYYIKEIEL